MKATLEQVSQIKRKMKVELTAEEVGEAFLKAQKKIKKEAAVPGFRKGKVPDKIIEQRFGGEIETEAVKQLVRDTYGPAIDEVKVSPLGDPEIVPQGQIKKDEAYHYEANFEVYPEVTVKGYDALKLEREKSEVVDEEVSAELQKLQQQMTQLEPVSEGEIGPGIVATIDFKGTADGLKFAGSEAENYVVDVDAGNILKEFESEIRGMKNQEERAISFKYPEDYFKKEIAGKKGDFQVKVKELRCKIVPELNDDFAKEIGKFASLGDVKDDIKKRIADYKEAYAKNMLKEQAIGQLIEKHKDLEVPVSLIEAELGNMLEQLDRNLRSQGRKLEDVKINPHEFVKANKAEAENRARGYMLVNAISKAENIDVTDAEFDTKLEEISKQGGQSKEKVKAHFEKKNLLKQLRAQMVFEKTLDFVVGKAKISEVKSKKKK